MPSFLRMSFFKTSKPRKFEPVPRFYDPQKEAIDLLMRKQEDSEKAKVERIKYKVKNNFQGSSAGSGRFSGSYKRSIKSSNLRLVIILFIMILLIYLVFIY
ncbi:MAG: hypothetical protein IPH57_07465 [Saprospiraceae bacterium]|nr:hypothetical protein [Saprospiraceae bacterium]